MSSTQFTVPTAFTIMDKFTGPVRGMQNGMSAFASKAEVGLARAERGFRRLISPLTAVNKLMMGLGIYVGLFSLVRLFTGAVDIVADFQQANADLAVVMGVTTKNNKALSLEARRVGLAYGEAATEVVKMQHALATLGFEQPEIMKMGAPLITGVAALEGSTTEKLAETVGAVVNTFNNLGAGDTQHILDVMALSANRTALNFEKLATTLPIVSGPANALNISFEETVALLGVLSNAGVHVATSATSLKNIFIDSAKKGHTYQEVLANIAKQSDKLTYANKKFGKRSVVSALVLEQKMFEAKNGVHALTEEFKNAELGLTEMIAQQRLDTFRGSVKLAKAAYQELILSIEDGTGKYAATFQQIAKVVGTMFLMASGSTQAYEALRKTDDATKQMAKTLLGWIDTAATVVKWLLIGKAALLVWRALVWGSTLAAGAFNIALGIMGGLSGTVAVSVGSSSVALAAYKATAWLATIATSAFNAALAVGLGTILAVAGAVAFLAGAVALIVIKWKEWGAAASMLLGPIGSLVSLVQSFRANWDYIANAFSAEGFIAGIKAIGRVIFDSMLTPLQQVLNIMALLPGAMGQNASKMSALIDAYRKQTGLTSSIGNETAPVERINGDAVKREVLNTNINESNTMKTITVDFKNVPSGVEISDENGKNLTPTTMSTMGWGQN